jgi:dihydropteroate synthase
MGDPRLRAVGSETGAAVVVMHIKGEPRVANPNPRYGDVVREVREFLLERAQLCVDEGIPRDRIIVDPGPGFGKTTEHDLAVIRGLKELTALPFPLLLAVSRKKFIGDVLGVGVEERLEGSLAVTAWGVSQGVRLVRTHDVREVRRVVTMAEAVMDPALVPA